MRHFSSLLLLSMAGSIVMTGCMQSNPSNPHDVVDSTYIHKYGVEVQANDWSSRGEDGTVISTLKNGVVITKSFSAGILDGETSFTFPHSNVIEKITTYAKGTLIKEVIYNLLGVPTQETLYQTPSITTITIWYETGSPKSIEHYEQQQLVQGEYYDMNHHLDSKVVDKNGTRTLRGLYGELLSYDLIEGGAMIQHTILYANGSPKEVIPYVNGILEGKKKTFLPAGEPNTIEEWVNGKQEGMTTLFQNGEKYAEIPYVNGEKTGIERHYRDETVVVEEISWLNNERHGPSNSFFGDLTKTEWYYQGKQMSKGSYDLLISRTTASAS